VTRLLELLLKYLEVLYLDPKYRITDSTTSDSPTENASLRVTGDIASWQVINDRGQMFVAVAPSRLDTADSIAETSCKALIALEEAKATELFGPP